MFNKKIKRIETLGEFKANSLIGKEYTILNRQEIIDASDDDHPDAELQGRIFFQTPSGRMVYLFGNGKYILDSGETVIRA